MVKNSPLRSYLLPSIKDGMTKKQISLLVQQSVKSVLEKGNVLQVAEAIAVMTEFIKGLKNNEQLMSYLRDELSKHGGKFSTSSGARIELSEVAVEYDYSGNGEWVSLDKEITALEEKRKALEDRLKRIPPGSLLVDEETGEVLTGPAKSSKSSYKITLQK